MPRERVRLEVAAPLDGRRCPARWDGKDVVAACGPVASSSTVFVVVARYGYERSVLKAEELAAALRRAKYRKVVVEV